MLANSSSRERCSSVSRQRAYSPRSRPVIGANRSPYAFSSGGVTLGPARNKRTTKSREGIGKATVRIGRAYRGWNDNVGDRQASSGRIASGEPALEAVRGTSGAGPARSETVLQKPQAALFSTRAACLEQLI